MPKNDRIDTGITGFITAPYPRPGSIAKGKSLLQIKPGKIAIHDGETPEQVQQFAAHLCAVWIAYFDKHHIPRNQEEFCDP